MSDPGAGARGTDHPLDVVVLGHVLNERVIFPDKVLDPVLGSPAAYASICMASLGVRVGVVTRVGDDFPNQLLNAFDEVGLAHDGLRRGGASTRDELIYHLDGRKTIRFLTRAAPLDFEDVPPAWRSPEAFYLCPMDHEVELDTVARLAELGRPMVVDLGGFGGATSAGHPAIKDGHELRELCPWFEVVKASSEDLEYVLGVGGGECQAAAQRLLDWGARAAVVTLGPDGVLVATPRGRRRFPAYHQEARSVLDPTGAGDCFAAGFLCEYVHSRDPFQAALYGEAVTSFVIERTGGAARARMPWRAEADERARQLRRRLAAAEAEAEAEAEGASSSMA